MQEVNNVQQVDPTHPLGSCVLEIGSYALFVYPELYAGQSVEGNGPTG